MKAVKSLFTVRLIKFEDTKKVQLIKAIKAIVAGMNLVQVNNIPLLTHLWNTINNTNFLRNLPMQTPVTWPSYPMHGGQ